MQKKDIKSHEGRISASNGTIRIIDTALHTDLKVDTILAEVASVVSVCSGINEAGDVIDLTAAPYLFTNLFTGIPYMTPHGVIITDIQLTSGNIACY